MRKIAFFSLILLWNAVLAQTQTGGILRGGEAVSPGERREKLEQVFPVVERLYKEYAERNHWPGMAFGIVVDGKLVYSGGAGFGNVKELLKAGDKMDFRIASMTKSFVSVAILQLRDSGLLRLDDPVSMYIPEMKGQKGAVSDAPEITIRNLLTHSAGFPEDNPWGDRQLADSNAQLLALVKDGLSFSNSPGIAYEYSNLGFTLLGYVIQKVTGESYERYISEHILTPLGMTHTYWEYSKVPAGQLAHGYRWLNDSWVEQPMLHDGAYGAMGGMITTVEDFSKYVAFQLAAWPSRSGPEDGPLRRSSRREMQQPWMFNSLNSGFSYYPGGPGCPVTSSYCYGLRWSKDCKGRTMVGHTGGLPGFGSNWMMLTDYGIGVICFSNLTYASAAAINAQVLDTMVSLARLKPRAVPVSPILAQRMKELLKLLPHFTGAETSPIFADNFWLDYFKDSLRKEAIAIFVKAGNIIRTEEIKAENNMRGSVVMVGEKGNIEVWFSLTPESEGKIQAYRIKFDQK